MNRKEMHEQLLKRTEESYGRKDGGINYKYFKVDNELPFWKPGVTKAEPHIIDILPFTAGKNYPMFQGRKTVRDGDAVYLLETEIHTNVGPGKELVICPAKNYGKPCPICEEIGRMRQNGAEWEEYRDIDTKRRCAYNVLVMTTQKDEEKGVQIWEVSHRFSEKAILSLAKSPRGGGYIAFSDPDRNCGKSIAFEVDDDTYRTVHGHKFIERDYDISDEILKKVYPLDELVVIYPYDKLKELFIGGQSEEKEKEPPVEEKEKEKEPPVEAQTRRARRSYAEEVSACPSGGKFGEDIDKLEVCSKCPIDVYEKCADKADKIEIEKKKESEQRPPASSSLRRR